MNNLISQEFFNNLISIRRKLHMYPELDTELPMTCDLIETILKKNNISYTRIDNFGVIAEIGNGDETIAFRADIDALPLNDFKSVNYASKIPHRIHACGHDVHTTIILGIAIILQSLNLPYKFRFIFQGAEETDGGAPCMIELGAIKDTKYILGIHTDISLDTNTIGMKQGTVTASSNPFTIEINGKGAHGAHPNTGVDSIIIASKTIDVFQTLITREIPATKNAVISIGQINGGETYNAIASKTTMKGILRTTDNTIKIYLKDRMSKILNEIAELYRGNATIAFKEGYPSFKNNNTLFDSFKECFTDDEYINLKEITVPSMGVDDFAYYANEIPGLYIKIGCRNESKGIIASAHSNYFDVDEECIRSGIYALLKFVEFNDKIANIGLPLEGKVAP